MSRTRTIFASSLVAFCGSVFAQSGLDSLSDDRLLTELGMRGMTTLLDRAFEVNKTPQAQRQALRVPVLISRLSSPDLSPKQRQELIQQISTGISAALPALKDPELLLNLATTLYNEGVAPLLNRLEYWGENPTVMSQLRPFAAAVGQIYDRAHEVADQQYTDLANKLRGPEDPNIARVDAAENLARAAEYNARMSDYVLALTIDSADPKRKDIIERAQKYLKEFDSPEIPARPFVRLQLAKLAMIAGDYKTAASLFSSVAGDGQEKIEPTPDVSQQYTARYFRAVTALLEKNAADAQKQLDDLLTWQAANLPKDKPTQDGAAGAASVLQYRIHQMRADTAASPDAKKQANDQAVAVLQKLLRDRPEFRGVINELLITKLGDDAPLAQLDPLMLQALVRRAEAETLKPEGAEFDKATIQRGIEAAKELLSRKGGDLQLRESVAYLLPFMQQKIGQEIEAVNSFLDFTQTYAGSERLDAALDNAQAVLGNLRSPQSGKADDPAVTAAYDRFLPIAINPPFNRKQFAFEYALVLRALGKNSEAIEMLKQVPADDKRIMTAKFVELVATRGVLNETADPAERGKLLARIQTLADEVNKSAQAALSAGEASAADKQRAQSMLASTLLIAADLARVDQKNPQRALQLLEGFEQMIASLPNAEVLRNEALQIRVPALMAAGKNTEATTQLVDLLKATGGERGQAIVYALLRKLDDDLDNAVTSGNADLMKEIARSRAALSGFLVTWAKDNADPNIKKYTYNYMRYDADAKHRAADVETDASLRKRGLAEALDLYKNLESPENLELYRATLPEGTSANRAHYDPAVWRGIALVSFDLDDYTEASRRLGKLLQDGRLGSAQMETIENGERIVVDNDDYWEGIYRLIASNVKLNANVEGQKDFLKQLYIKWGDRVGGRKWKKEMAALQQELIPDFDAKAILGT